MQGTSVTPVKVGVVTGPTTPVGITVTRNYLQQKLFAATILRNRPRYRVDLIRWIWDAINVHMTHARPSVYG